MKKTAKNKYRKNKKPTIVSFNDKEMLAIKVEYSKTSKTIQAVALKKANVSCSVSELLERRKKNIIAFKQMELY